jgi:hypothetical protein
MMTAVEKAKEDARLYKMLVLLFLCVSLFLFYSIGQVSGRFIEKKHQLEACETMLTYYKNYTI